MSNDWTDTRASTWYEGYDSDATGSFVNLKELKETADPRIYQAALSAVQENVIGLFEQKGVTRAQAQSSPEYQQIMSQANQGILIYLAQEGRDIGLLNKSQNIIKMPILD